MAIQETFDDILKGTKIIEMPLESVLPDSMMPYAEYVIMNRALPRVEDGLKPVQRRILYSMYEQNIGPDGAHKKSARVVGDCLGKYHPHGDRSVYDAMVRMAQDFNMGMTLIDGHGNFGSIDGDSAAAMRYTEVRLTKLAMELLADLDKDTVAWEKNFDDTLDEPKVLPGRFPNLLVNGASGIAIGLATNIPPHNLGEVIDASIALIDQPRTTLEELLQIIKGPDFPTGGYILRDEGLYSLYESGAGKIVMRAKADIENVEGGRQNIVITEIPFQENKSRLEQRIFELKERKKDILGGIIDVADESDRSGMRIVVKLKKGEDAIKILDYLYKNTNLQSNFAGNMVAIAAGKPRQMGLIEILKYYLDFQRNIIVRRSKYDLACAEKRSHILEGYLIILPDFIDEAIALIKESSGRTEARAKLRERFNLSEAQAEAILSLQLSQLNKLDVKKFENEQEALLKEIINLKDILSSSKKQMEVVKKELQNIKQKHSVRRKTVIVDNLEDIEIRPFEAGDKNAKKGYFAITADGKVKFILSRQFLAGDRHITEQGYYGLAKAVALADIDREVLIFGSMGNCYRFSTAELPERKWEEQGDALSALDPTAPEGELACAIVSFKNNSTDGNLLIYTAEGMVKRSKISEYLVNRISYQGMVLKEGDSVIGAEIERENSTVIFVTSDGMCVNAEMDEIPLQGRKAGGVKGINLSDGAKVVLAAQCPGEVDEGGNVIQSNGELVLLSDKGFAKRVLAKNFEVMKRARKGIKCFDLVNTNGQSIVYASLLANDIAIVTPDKRVIPISVSKIRLEPRAGKGMAVVKKSDLYFALGHAEEEAQG
ncbi:MAG: DNA gyrase/topoisomerase IV subunit A [Christensenellales bacterium]|jgi:DNA gyrase subunit A